MTDYFVHPGLATGNNDGSTWADAFQTWAAAATPLAASGNRFYVKYDATSATGAALTLAGPASGVPNEIISADGTGTSATYTTATAANIATGAGAFAVELNGSFAVYGMRIQAGSNVRFVPDSNETLHVEDCYLLPGPNGQIITANDGVYALHNFHALTVDCAADAGTQRTATIFDFSTKTDINGLTLLNGADRPNLLSAGQDYRISGGDFTGASRSGALLFGTSAAGGRITLNNIKLHANTTKFGTGVLYPATEILMLNVNTDDAPESLGFEAYVGRIVSSTTVKRTGGAEVETVGCSWLVTTRATCAEGSPLRSPWIYGTTTAGTKTFTAHVAHNAQGGGAGSDLTDAECWLEVQAMATADSPAYTLSSDRRTITTGAAVQTDDTDSSWSGSPGSNLQKLIVSGVTVGEEGLYRARFCFGKASITGGVYCDPKVTVT
jgi:hypothetical protein